MTPTIEEVKRVANGIGIPVAITAGNASAEQLQAFAQHYIEVGRKDAEIANLVNAEAEAMALVLNHEGHIEKLNAKIASRDLTIKDLREALVDCAEVAGNISNSAYNKAHEALAKSEHHDSRALEKMLLEAEINALKQAAEMCIPYDQEFQHLITNRQAKLAELNKE